MLLSNQWSSGFGGHIRTSTKGAHLALRSGMNKNWRLFVFYKMIGFSFSAPVCCDFSDQLRGAGARKYVVWDTQHEQEGQRLHV